MPANCLPSSKHIKLIALFLAPLGLSLIIQLPTSTMHRLFPGASARITHMAMQIEKPAG
jgi:hypothetical protein